MALVYLSSALPMVLQLLTVFKFTKRATVTSCTSISMCLHMHFCRKSSKNTFYTSVIYIHTLCLLL